MEEDCMETRIEEIARLLIDKLLAVRREVNVMINFDVSG